MIRSSRIGLTHATLALFGLAIIGKAVKVQVVDGSAWRARAERQQSTERVVPAPRGDIVDETHRVLAQSREMVRLEIAPREVNAPAKLRRALARLGVDKSLIARALDPKGKYLVLPGRFLAVDAADAIGLRGVHSYASVERAYAASRGAQGIIGHVDINNKPIDGLELALDSVLRGEPGSATVFRDLNGQLRESPIAPGTAPVKGDTVVLTINADLQEIAENALADAVARMGAEGGDIVILDPHTGEVLAMASRRLDPRQSSATVMTEPFEPGSTMKPFTAAALLRHGLVTDHDSVDTGDGVYEINGRVIHDDHRIGRAPLSEVLRWSSNVGIVKFAERLTPREEYENLRDFGFGTPTGVPYPTESGGILRNPTSWSKQSANSMAMGYEVSVTPLQLAAAYAVFANGGELMEPALVKEVVAPDGTVLYRHTPRVVRRVVPKPVADKVRHMLLDVVDEGTALQAALDNYMLAGKTGTPRGTVRGRYIPGRYNPNFVGLFPGDNPQYVIVVKVTAPQSSIYAAQTAAPVTKAILQAAVAAQNAALDRAKLAASVVADQKADTKAAPVRQMAEARPESLSEVPDTAPPAERGSVPFVATLPLQPSPPPPRTLHAVPDIRGLPLRDAVRSLHSAGFHVQLARGGADGSASTSPAAGAMEPTGTVVRLLYNY
ncbi:MAG TPA: penicillin-binding transpeptidase domain-containing protein [Gemmatimonadaceae bacterium]|nr:penicillin-binding transpeptidase domain-containing protein [Gemmatimonadaceae bacterium]